LLLLLLQAYERMRAQGCRADAIVFNAIIDALWETGVVWVQRRALKLFRVAVEEGHFHQGKLVPGLARAEVNLHAMTAGVAMLSLYAWLVSLKQLVAQHGPAALPMRLAVVTDRGKGSKEQGNLVVKEAVQACMALWGAPFRWAAGWLGLVLTQPPAVCMLPCCAQCSVQPAWQRCSF
jgi:pentatricopeptide repeat domain-containing protein 1